MKDTRTLKVLMEDISVALIMMREGLRQTELLEAEQSKGSKAKKSGMPGIKERKERLRRSIARFDRLLNKSQALVIKIEKRNADELRQAALEKKKNDARDKRREQAKKKSEEAKRKKEELNNDRSVEG